MIAPTFFFYSLHISWFAVINTTMCLNLISIIGKEKTYFHDDLIHV